MDIFSIITLFGGVGLFLYGMKLMGDSLKNLAGGSLEKILGKFTTGKNEVTGRLKGLALGTGVTAIIQSSAATTIMLIGFVNAGIMTLAQAIPVVFGANIGSTATAQIIRLGGGTASSNIFLRLLKPSSFAPLLVGIGAFMLLFIKKKKKRDVAGILVGLGVLFFGITTMEGVFKPLQDSESFKALFNSFSNPAIGILLGLGLTALIQSSSASVGILQALSSTGAVTIATTIPMIIGINIGKCMTIILGGIGANKKAKRVSVSYLVFNVIGAIFFTALIYSVDAFVHFDFWNELADYGSIADIHLGFNLIMALILIPFTTQISKLTGVIVKDNEVSKTDRILETLDERLVNTPTTALSQSRKVMVTMIDTIMENYFIASSAIFDYDEKKIATIMENEDFIDKCETSLNDYLLQVTNKNMLTGNLRRFASEMLNSVSDLERIGDHCASLAHVATSMKENGIEFSNKGRAELDTIMSAVEKILDSSFTAFKEDNAEVSLRVEILSEIIEDLKENIKDHHVNRLQTKECSVEAGFILIDILTSLERIGKHCTNVAHHVTKRFSPGQNFDEMHGHAYSVAVKKTEDYKALYLYYEQLYLAPVRKYDAVAVEEIDAVDDVIAEELPDETEGAQSADIITESVDEVIQRADKKADKNKKKKHK